MGRVQLTDEEGKFLGPRLPIGEYGPCPERLRVRLRVRVRVRFEGVIRRFRLPAVA